MCYLKEKHKIPFDVWNGILSAMHEPSDRMIILPVTQEVALALDQIPRVMVPDMPDRIIAATALAQGLPLVTADRKIRALTNITTIW